MGRVQSYLYCGECYSYITMAVNPNEKFIPIRLPGEKGWNAFLDASAIADDELADAQNVSYDKGFVSTREGSTLLYSKPAGETGDPLQLITAQTSDGLQYLIAIYSNHFYLYHEANAEWIRINQTYVPTETSLFYGYVNWQNGRGDDRLYVCNGVDDAIRWDICVDQANGAQVAGAATLVIDDATRFPATGTLVIKGASTTFTEAYTSHTGTTFTLTNTLNENVADNASVTLDMIQKASMEIGKHLQKNQRRLFMANYYGGETVIKYSIQNDPEDFTVASTIAGGGTETIADGNGEITGMHDFGEFLVVEKEDSLHSFSFDIAADLGTKLAVIKPLTSGEHLGPLDSGSTVKVGGRLLYPTKTNGFISLTPTSSGGSVSVDVSPLSQNIKPYIDTTLDLQYARVASNNHKVWWSVARVGATINTLVLMYDTLRNTWSRHVGWAIKDFTVKNDEVLYLDVSSGAVYQIENGSYNDNNAEYETSMLFKRFDFGEIGRPKSQDVIYLSGYMTTATEFFVDVMFNEEGVLGKQTYRINKDTTGLYFSSPITDEMGAFILGVPILGMVALEGIANLSSFRCYLAINKTKGFYNIQARAYGTRAAFWGISAMAHNPEILPIVPTGFLVAPEIET